VKALDSEAAVDVAADALEVVVAVVEQPTAISESLAVVLQVAALVEDTAEHLLLHTVVDSVDLLLLRLTVEELLLMAGELLVAMAVEAMVTHPAAVANLGGKYHSSTPRCSLISTFSTRYNA